MGDLVPKVIAEKPLEQGAFPQGGKLAVETHLPAIYKGIYQPERGKHDRKRRRNPDELQ